MKPIGTGAVSLAAAMGQAFSIQSFFIPVIKKAPNPSKYIYYVLIAYIAGAVSYYYIAYAGSIGINMFIKQFGIVTTTTRQQSTRQLKTTLIQANGKSI